MKSMMLCCLRGRRLQVFRKLWARRLLAEIRRQLFIELARIDERIVRRHRIDEEIERIDDRHVGQQVDRDAELGGPFRKYEARQPVSVRILLPIHEVLGRRHLERIAADGRAGVGRGPEPDDLGSERNRAVVSIPGDVLETDED